MNKTRTGTRSYVTPLMTTGTPTPGGTGDPTGVPPGVTFTTSGACAAAGRTRAKDNRVAAIAMLVRMRAPPSLSRKPRSALSGKALGLVWATDAVAHASHGVLCAVPDGVPDILRADFAGAP